MINIHSLKYLHVYSAQFSKYDNLTITLVLIDDSSDLFSNAQRYSLFLVGSVIGSTEMM